VSQSRTMTSSTPGRRKLTQITRRFTVLCGALTLMTGLVVTQATTATAADSLTFLGDVTGAGDIAVGGGKVFVATDDRIIVADTEGTLTSAITGLSEVRDLVTTPDGTRLYAAVRGSHEVTEINTADLAITRRIDLTAYPCPGRLALSGNWLWVSHGCPAASSGGALGLDLSTATPQPVPIPTGGLANPPQIAAAANTLVVVDFWNLRVYDLQDGALTLRGAIDSYDHELWNGWGAVALAPDGLTAYTPGSANDINTWDLTTLTKARSYGKEEGVLGYGNITVSPDGTQMAVSRDTDDVNDEPLVLFDVDTGVKAQLFDQSLIWTHGLAFSGSDLFAVVEKTIDRSFHLWRLHGASLPSCKIVVTGPEQTRLFRTITFTGQLTEHDGSAPGVQPLTVAFRQWDGTTTALPNVTTNADGTFTFTHKPMIVDTLSYDVYRDNTPGSRSCEATAAVNVSW
jgi:WD40 repeat protein